MFATSGQHILGSAFKTDTGLKRTINQDAVLIDTDMGLFAIADGMGGHNAGEIASEIAVTTLTKSLRVRNRKNMDLAELMEHGFRDAHEAILSASMGNPCYDNMGTTLVAAMRDGASSFTIGNVGDSRAYRISSQGIELLTEDHTFMVEWIRQGLVSIHEARHHPARHGLYMALGIDDEFQPRITRVELDKTDILLLCSDGLTDMVDENSILNIVRNVPSLEAACNRLIAEANANGGHDNCSAVLIHAGASVI